MVDPIQELIYYQKLVEIAGWDEQDAIETKMKGEISTSNILHLANCMRHRHCEEVPNLLDQEGARNKRKYSLGTGLWRFSLRLEYHLAINTSSPPRKDVPRKLFGADSHYGRACPRSCYLEVNWTEDSNALLSSLLYTNGQDEQGTFALSLQVV